jgi:RNA polymerase sigma factor (sigma-70 family)
MYTGCNDAELIHRILLGEPSLYAQLVERYQSYVFTLVLRITGNREDAEEVAQDVFVKAYRSLADFRQQARFSTWLYTIARTSCFTFLRKKKMNILPLDDGKEGAHLAHLTSESGAMGLEQKSRHLALNRAIRLLGPDDALIITLFYQGEQTLEEIAQIMGLNPNAVKVRLHRARLKLKEKMETHFPTAVKEWQED